MTISIFQTILYPFFSPKMIMDEDDFFFFLMKTIFRFCTQLLESFMFAIKRLYFMNEWGQK